MKEKGKRENVMSDWVNWKNLKEIFTYGRNFKIFSDCINIFSRFLQSGDTDGKGLRKEGHYSFCTLRFW